MEFAEFLELEEFRSILEIVNEDRSSGGRSPFDVLLMFRLLILKVYFDVNYDGIIEKVKTDDACQCFLAYPIDLPVGSTLWDFHQKITNNSLNNEIWNYHKILMEKKGLS
jgi:hypothetical protein